MLLADIAADDCLLARGIFANFVR